MYTPNASFSGTDSFTYKANDGTSDSNIATVSITVSTPTNSDGKVTAGGAQLGKDVNFGFSVHSKQGQEDEDDDEDDDKDHHLNSVKGELEYLDKAVKIKLHSVRVTSVDIGANKRTATFGGTATINGEGTYAFTVTVEDNGEPGKNDKFTITIPELGYTKGGTLTKGNIQIHS